jgi:hypothetical protein
MSKPMNSETDADTVGAESSVPMPRNGIHQPPRCACPWQTMTLSASSAGKVAGAGASLAPRMVLVGNEPGVAAARLSLPFVCPQRGDIGFAW